MPVIAIVDDNDPFRHATASFIRSLGYAVPQFASAEAFLKSNRSFFRRRSPQLSRAPRVCVRKPDTNVVWNLTDVKAARAPDYLRPAALIQ